MRTVFVVLLLVGLVLSLRGFVLLYSETPEKTPEEEKKITEKKELDAILEEEVLRGKANIQQIDNDELLEFMFKQKPSEIYSDMFDRDPFRIGV